MRVGLYLPCISNGLLTTATTVYNMDKEGEVEVEEGGVSTLYGISFATS